MRQARRSGWALEVVVDIGLGGLGIWLVLGGMGKVATALFVGANVATLFTFRSPLRKDLRVHSRPLELPVALVFFSLLFAWPALQVTGWEGPGWALLNLAVLVVARTLMMIATIRARRQHS